MFRTWQHLIFLHPPASPCPQGWDFFYHTFKGPYSTPWVTAPMMSSWKPNLNLHSYVCQGSRALAASFRSPCSAPHGCSAPCEAQHVIQYAWLSTPWPQAGLDGCFPTPCCLAPWRSGGSMHCNPITSSPWGKERRQEASQKTENKRLSNLQQQNREFHEGMLNLVAP